MNKQIEANVVLLHNAMHAYPSVGGYEDDNYNTTFQNDVKVTITDNSVVISKDNKTLREYTTVHLGMISELKRYINGKEGS